jgi:hypothetical protein
MTKRRARQVKNSRMEELTAREVAAGERSGFNTHKKSVQKVLMEAHHQIQQFLEMREQLLEMRENEARTKREEMKSLTTMMAPMYCLLKSSSRSGSCSTETHWIGYEWWREVHRSLENVAQMGKRVEKKQYQERNWRYCTPASAGRRYV